MWIYTRTGFVSIVEDRDDSSRLYVRARRLSDLKNFVGEFCPNSLIYDTPDSDYAYRCHLPRHLVRAIVASCIMDIDYPNFKDSLDEADPPLTNTYYDVWQTTVEGYGTGIYASMYSIAGPQPANNSETRQRGDSLLHTEIIPAEEAPAYLASKQKKDKKKGKKNKGK